MRTEFYWLAFSALRIPRQLGSICPDAPGLWHVARCWEAHDERTIVEACQCSQDAQAGYACDYCSKRQPMAFNEIKECCKGHAALNQKLSGERLNYVGKRHASRFMSDAYGKGIVRGHAENTNLRAYAKQNDVCFAESMQTSQCTSFFGKEFLEVVERLNDNKKHVGKACFAEVDRRSSQRRRVAIRNVSLLYGQRPQHPDIWYLSPYEFVRYWEPTLCSYPLSEEQDAANVCHARLTVEGLRKVRSQHFDLNPGLDYEVQGGGSDWIPYPDLPSTTHFRHTWVLVRSTRPKVPTFFGAPVPKHTSGEHQRAAAIVMCYFHPWTLRKNDASDCVKYAGALRASDETWQDALQKWLEGHIICQEAKQYIGYFLSVHRVRP